MQDTSLPLPPHLSLSSLPTPMEKLSVLSGQFPGKNIYIKRDDLTGMELSGNKIRKLEFCLAKAIQKKYDGIITTGGLGSNHCRASAFSCKKINLECRLLLRGNHTAPGDANTFFMRELGFPIRYISPVEYKSNIDIMKDWAKEEFEKEGKRFMIIPSGASNATGCWGYIRAFQEIVQQSLQTGIVYDTLFCAVGSGGTYAGLWLGNYLYNYGARIVGINVCDSAAYFQREIISIIESFSREYDIYVPPNPKLEIIDGYSGPAYGICSSEQVQFIRQTFTTEGIVLDPVYTGKAFYGMCKELSTTRYRSDRNILFIHTGGIFGLFCALEDWTKSRETINNE